MNSDLELFSDQERDSNSECLTNYTFILGSSGVTLPIGIWQSLTKSVILNIYVRASKLCLGADMVLFSERSGFFTQSCRTIHNIYELFLVFQASVLEKAVSHLSRASPSSSALNTVPHEWRQQCLVRGEMTVIAFMPSKT